MIGFMVVFGVWLKWILFSLDWFGFIVKIVIGILYSWERVWIFKFFFYLSFWIFFKNICYLYFFWLFVFFIVVLIVLFFGCKTLWFGFSGRYRKFLYDILFEVFGLVFKYLISCFLSFLGLFGSLWIWRFRMKVWYR